MLAISWQPKSLIKTINTIFLNNQGLYGLFNHGS